MMQTEIRAVCEPGDDDQCPNDRNPIFFTGAPTRTARAAFLTCEAATDNQGSGGSVLEVTTWRRRACEHG
jgi:hypothetical protein